MVKATTTQTTQLTRGRGRPSKAEAAVRRALSHGHTLEEIQAPISETSKRGRPSILDVARRLAANSHAPFIIAPHPMRAVTLPLRSAIQSRRIQIRTSRIVNPGVLYSSQKWKKRASDRPHIEREPYRVGPSDDIKQGDSMLSVFQKLFLTERIVSHVHEHTNANYKKDKESKSEGWQEITKHHIFTYFAILLMMCINPRRAYADYWQEHDPINGTTGVPWIKSRMGRDAWLRVHKYLGFKIEWVILECIANTQKCFLPTRELGLDESLVPFKGVCVSV